MLRLCELDHRHDGGQWTRFNVWTVKAFFISTKNFAMLVNRNISKLKSRMFYMKIQHSFVFYFKHGRKLITWINRLSFIQNGSLNISLPALVKNKSKDIWFTDYTLQPMGGGRKVFCPLLKTSSTHTWKFLTFSTFCCWCPHEQKNPNILFIPSQSTFWTPSTKII